MPLYCAFMSYMAVHVHSNVHDLHKYKFLMRRAGTRTLVCDKRIANYTLLNTANTLETFTDSF